MGLKSWSSGLLSPHSYTLKSDQNGIEIKQIKFLLSDERELKSDQNGIEIYYIYRILLLLFPLKSDQNGIEIWYSFMLFGSNGTS